MSKSFWSTVLSNRLASFFDVRRILVFGCFWIGGFCDDVASYFIETMISVSVTLNVSGLF